MQQAARAAEQPRYAVRAAKPPASSREEIGLLGRWTTSVPAIVWLLLVLHALFLERRLADRRSGAVIENLPLFLAEVAGSFAALFVYGWLVALIVPRNRFLATAISAVVVALYSLMLLYHWHTRGQFDWGVLWRFRRELLELGVRRTIGSFMGWRSYVLPAGAIAAVVLLEAAGRVFSRPCRPRRRSLATAAGAIVAAGIVLGPMPTSDELTGSLRATEGRWRLAR